MKKFLGVLLSVCLLLGLTAFPAAASGETSDRVMFVQCDNQNMTANFYFTPNPGAYWSEMGIYTEPQDGWDQDSSGKLVRLSNIVPSSLWRVGPSSMTDGDGKVNGTQILDSHFEFTAGVTYYVYMCYYDGANWNVIPDYYSFVFEDGPADGDVFDEDQLVLHADMNNTKITTDAGAGSFFEVTFDSIYASGTPDDGCYRRDFNQNVKRNASSTVLGIDNNGGEIGISFQGYRWNGGGTDENFYFTGEAEGCDGIYLISKTGETARAEVEYSLYRYQVIIPAGFDGYVSIPNTRIGKGNSEESVGNYDHSADQYILYWSPSLFVQTKTADAADVNFNAFGSLFYKVGENAPVPGDDAADQIEELLGELPESINAANMQSVKETLDAVSELLTANPDLEEQFAAQYQAALSAYNAVAAVVADMDEAIADLADAEMNEANEAAWKEAIKELYSIIASAEEDGVDVSGLKEEADAYAADFAKAYGYAWNTVKPGDNTGDFGILAAALAAAAGSGAIALRRKRR